VIDRKFEDLRDDVEATLRHAERNGGYLTEADKHGVADAVCAELDARQPTQFLNEKDDEESAGDEDANEDADTSRSKRQPEDSAPGSDDDRQPVVVYVPGHNGPLEIDWEATLR
jgi:hypothetical protein